MFQRAYYVLCSVKLCLVLGKLQGLIGLGLKGAVLITYVTGAGVASWLKRSRLHFSQLTGVDAGDEAGIVAEVIGSGTGS